MAAFNVVKSGYQNLEKLVSVPFICSLCSKCIDLHYIVASEFQPQSLTWSDPCYPGLWLLPFVCTSSQEVHSVCIFYLCLLVSDSA